MLRFGILATLCAMLSLAALADGVNVVVINRQPMIPLRAVCDTWGAVIDYDGGRDAISISLNDRCVSMIPYSQTAWIDGRVVALDAPVVIIDDVTYVPVRFLCDAFDMDCQCSEADQHVVIINRRTRACFTLVIDVGWPQRRHVMRHDYNCRDYCASLRHYRIDPPHHEGWGMHGGVGGYHGYDGHPAPGPQHPPFHGGGGQHGYGPGSGSHDNGGHYTPGAHGYGGGYQGTPHSPGDGQHNGPTAGSPNGHDGGNGSHGSAGQHHGGHHQASSDSGQQKSGERGGRGSSRDDK